MKPPKSILDPSFKYTDAANTSVRATFARIRREQKAEAAKQATVVTPLKRREQK